MSIYLSSLENMNPDTLVFNNELNAIGTELLKLEHCWHGLFISVFFREISSLQPSFGLLTYVYYEVISSMY